MRKKLTITVDEQVYSGLHRVVGRQHISQFIEDLVRPHVMPGELRAAYRAMAQDSRREADALDSLEASVRDTARAIPSTRASPLNVISPTTCTT